MRPSRKSVTPATQKKNSASVYRNGIGHGQNSAQRKTTVSTKRETVSLFGRFIQKLWIDSDRRSCVISQFEPRVTRIDMR